MKSILTQLTIYLLLLSGVYLSLLIKEELYQYRASRDENALTPRDGSLHGIDSTGKTKAPNLDASEHLNGSGNLLIFVVHHQDIMNDIRYWNRVIDLVNGLRSQSHVPIQYWGICDDGRACNSYGTIAHFSILGFLDPYEMHIVSKADANHESLLYDRSMIIKAHIANMSDPLVEFKLIQQRLK